MTTKTQEITLVGIARKLAKIASAQHQCAEQLIILSEQLARSSKTKPRSSNRRNDRHAPGYMAEYMRKWRARRGVKQ